MTIQEENDDLIVDTVERFLEPEPPSRKPKPPKRKAWRPKMGPIGYEILKARSVLDRPNDVLVKLLYG